MAKEKKVKEEKCCECGECCEEQKKEFATELTSEEVLVLKNTIENLNNKVLTAQAELINYRKRKDEETSNMLKYANLDIISDILPVIDNFERALNYKSESPEFDKFINGFKIIYTHLVDLLKKYGVEEIKSDDENFDPTYHEALMVGCDEEKEDNIILETFSKGYILKGRVIRPAKVRVNKLD